jgi:hypothetical protein
MTPTPTVLLLVALFWTLPATTAALAYRTHESPFEALKERVEQVLGQPELQPQPDA